MFRVTVTKSFSAAHALKIGGKCEDLHGHNFRVDVAVEGPELSPEGLLIDFRDLKRWTVEVLDELDHKFLNELTPFSGDCATSERVARYLFERIAARMQGQAARLAEVTVWESDNARVSYTGEGR
ncbi:MAG: 6-carboxytetrahydropterin synthase [Syntrophales bacterium]|nr:6-carboxytetrahydropterin synthase [Syntrophales bacterium]